MRQPARDQAPPLRSNIAHDYPVILSSRRSRPRRPFVVENETARLAEQGRWRSGSANDDFGWMLVPSLMVGWLGMSVYIAWFTSLHLSPVLSVTTGRIGLLAAGSASLAFGTKSTHLLLGSQVGSQAGQFGRLTSYLVVLIISGTVLLLLLDAIALCRM